MVVERTDDRTPIHRPCSGADGRNNVDDRRPAANDDHDSGQN